MVKCIPPCNIIAATFGFWQPIIWHSHVFLVLTKPTSWWQIPFIIVNNNNQPVISTIVPEPLTVPLCPCWSWMTRTVGLPSAQTMKPSRINYHSCTYWHWLSLQRTTNWPLSKNCYIFISEPKYVSRRTTNNLRQLK